MSSEINMVGWQQPVITKEFVMIDLGTRQGHKVVDVKI